jgi:hypothetical protein
MVRTGQREKSSLIPTEVVQHQAAEHLLLTMSYFIAAISNGGGAPEQAYRKMQTAGACPEKPFAGELNWSRKKIFR